MKDNKIPVSQEIKKHLLTGISWYYSFCDLYPSSWNDLSSY